MKLKVIKRFSLIVFMLLTIHSCERDDICPEDIPTTPRLIVEFYDLLNQESIKDVPNLRVQGVGNDNPITNFSGTSTVNKVELPLKTDANSTQFRFIKNYAIDDEGNVTGNEDIITINYIPENVYVSRACGYKTVYKAINIQFDENDADRWIALAQSLNDNQSIENETTTHYYFFHQ